MLLPERPKSILIGGREVLCDSEEDLVLLREAKIVEDATARVLELSIGRLHLIKEACQRYSLGKHQRLVSLAIDRLSR